MANDAIYLQSKLDDIENEISDLESEVSSMEYFGISDIEYYHELCRELEDLYQEFDRLKNKLRELEQ